MAHCSVEFVLRKLRELDNRIRNGGVEGLLYTLGFVLVVAGLLPGQDFGAFKIPPLPVIAQITFGVVGTLIVFMFSLRIIGISLGSAILSAALSVALIVIIICVALAPSDAHESTEWLLTDLTTAIILANSSQNHPEEYDHLDDKFKEKLDPDRAFESFRINLNYLPDGLNPETVEHTAPAPFLFVTAAKSSGEIRFEELTEIDRWRELNVALGMILHRDTSISPGIFLTCIEVSCQIVTTGEHAAVFIYPLDQESRAILDMALIP